MLPKYNIQEKNLIKLWKKKMDRDSEKHLEKDPREVRTWGDVTVGILGRCGPLPPSTSAGEKPPRFAFDQTQRKLTMVQSIISVILK